MSEPRTSIATEIVENHLGAPPVLGVPGGMPPAEPAPSIDQGKLGGVSSIGNESMNVSQNMPAVEPGVMGSNAGGAQVTPEQVIPQPNVESNYSRPLAMPTVIVEAATQPVNNIPAVEVATDAQKAAAEAALVGYRDAALPTTVGGEEVPTPAELAAAQQKIAAEANAISSQYGGVAENVAAVATPVSEPTAIASTTEPGINMPSGEQQPKRKEINMQDVEAFAGLVEAAADQITKAMSYYEEFLRLKPKS
jgi:hypothetical protein